MNRIQLQQFQAEGQLQGTTSQNSRKRTSDTSHSMAVYGDKPTSKRQRQDMVDDNSDLHHSDPVRERNEYQQGSELEAMDENHAQYGLSEWTDFEFHPTTVWPIQDQSGLQLPLHAMELSEIPTGKSIGRDLHLLAIEGRGVCGLAALIILKEVLRQYQYVRKLPQLPRPCDVFDLAGGVGTGGIIAIMLFRLGMTVDEAITAYTRLSEDVFYKKSVLWPYKKTNASLLENAVSKVIHSTFNIDKSQAQKIRMLGEGPKCFVSAFTAQNLSSPTLFRSYQPPRHASYNCTVVEAIRATTAEEPFLSILEMVKATLEEAIFIFPGQRISCMLSIGNGAEGIAGFEAPSTTEFAKVVKNDSESISDEVAKELSDKGVFYCRLNVDYGLQDIGFEDWERLGDVRTHTRKYLEKYDVAQKVSQLVQALNRRTVILSTAEDTLRNLSQFLDGLISVVPRQSWSTAACELIRVIKPSKAATETLNTQCALLRDTLESCLQGRNFAKLPNELKENIGQLLKGLNRTFQDLPEQEDPMTHVNTNIRNLLQRFWVQNHISGNIVVHDILKYIQKDDLMKKTFTRLEQHAINQNLCKLNAAPFAAYDSSEVSGKMSCFKGTRVRLLNEIGSWIAGTNPGLAPIYVLDGVAGIGKTTIAKTVAEQAAGINALGASFFFSRNDNKRKTAKTFFPTIASQLAYYDQDFANKINKALLCNPHIVTKMPLTQFSTLIMEPLKESLAVVGNPIVIVIDALDECEDDGDDLLKIFADSIKNMPRLKLFITTRPEHHIRTVLDRYDHLKRFYLQEIEKSVVQSDIRLYLEFYLSENQVRDKLPDLKCTWKPVAKDMEKLIGICGTLFIIASTAVKFILDIKQLNPAKQLSRLLRDVSDQDFSGSKYSTAMDAFYTQILLAAVPDDDDDDDDDGDGWIGRYQTVVGTIVALQYPLPCCALSSLLNIDSDDVMRALCHLYSLLAPSGQDLTFRIHHKSFPDFVTNYLRCESRFLIDLTTRHLELGKQCLKTMISHLKPNICNLGATDRFKDNDVIRHLIQDHITQELAYASTHWGTHLAKASKLDGEAEQLLEYFARKHFLAWLEVLSIIAQVEIAYPSLDRIVKLLDESSSTPSISCEIFHDGCRFVASNVEIIKIAAGHVFSALEFAPQNTRLFRTYNGLEGINLKVISGHETNWNPTISVMSAYANYVTSVAFSRDGMKLVSADDDTMRLWDGQTGAEIATLRGHSDRVNWVGFSPDGMKVVSASRDRTVRQWDVQTGAELAVLQGHSDSVNSAVYSPDGLKMASASDDCTVRVWDGRIDAVLREHSDSVNSVVFSPDGRKLASASDDCTVRLWDSQTHIELAVLRGQSDGVNSVVFSPDGKKLASASDDCTVRLWDSETHIELAVLRGHSDSVNSVVFSPDGKKLASASGDCTVRLWDSETHIELAVFRGHSDWPVNSVVFSPDGKKLASASDDCTVRLWDSQTETNLLQGHSALVHSIVYSPDGTRLASASNDTTVRLWVGQTCAELAVLEGHLKGVNSVEFSPDGTKLASASCDRTIRLWDGQTGAGLAVLQGHSALVNSVVFSPDGANLASASDDQTVRLWDGQTGAELAVLQGHSKQINAVVFSPDGMKLASGSRDGTVRLWDRAGTEIAVFEVNSDLVEPVVFSPDGTKLASGSYDRTMLWDAQTGTKITFPGSHFAAFTLDSSRLLSMHHDGELYQINCITGDRLGMPGPFINSAEGIRVPHSNLWIIEVNREEPLLYGLFVVKVDNNGILSDFISICWFPSNFVVTSLAVSPPSRVAVGRADGRILFLDIDFSLL